MAVFESWRITSFVAKRNIQTKSKIEVTRNEKNKIQGLSDNSQEHVDQATQYYLAALLALTLSLITIPFGYIFIGYGNIFIVGFIIHGLGSFYYWLKSQNFRNKLN